MTEDQKHTLECVSKWLLISEKNGYRIPADAIAFAISSSKSSLLKRLLSGEDPFPYAPPKSYSYPWYELLEQGGYKGWAEVFVSSVKHLGDKELIVNQSAWHLLEQSTDSFGYVRYVAMYNKEEGSVWEIQQVESQQRIAWQFTLLEEGKNQLWLKTNASNAKKKLDT